MTSHPFRYSSLGAIRAVRRVLKWLGALVVCSQLHAVPLTPGNILISRLDTFQITEYTPAGAVVQTFNITPSTSAPTESLRDIVVDANGNVQIYNGTFDPVLSSLNPTTGSLSNRTFPGFSTINNGSFGGIGVFGSFVFTTDMQTFGEPADEAKGIVRFDLSSGTALRFGEIDGYQDLTIGGDNLVYALPGEGLPANRIDVFDPTSLALVRSINLDSALFNADVRGIAVGFDGTIYAAAWNGFVYALDEQGMILNSRNTGEGDLTDIDLDALGRLVIGSRFGEVILTDIALATQISFNVDNQEFGENIHVAWVIPEPTTVTLLVVALCFLTLGWWRSRLVTRSRR
jgi:hypothetical protein